MESRPQPPRARSAATSSTCASTRWPSAATASRGPTAATSCSSAARSPATASAPRSPSATAATPRRARSRCSSRGRTASSRSPIIPGAPWQVLAYERQLEIKAQQVDDALRRIGQLDGYELEEIVPAVEQWRYRNKLEYSFGTGDDGALVCGFHAPGSWERIEPMTDCLLASEAGNAARESVLAWARAQGLGAYDRRIADRAAAQPRRARGAADRPDRGSARHQSKARSTPTR